MSKKVKNECFNLAEELMLEIDKLPDLESKRSLVGWFNNFWANITKDLAGYSGVTSDDVKVLAKKGFANKIQTGRDLLNKNEN